MAVEIKDSKLNEFLNTANKKSLRISKSRELGKIYSPIVFADIQRHFSKQEGPKGKWKKLNPRYRKVRFSQGFTGPILQKTGRLKNGFLPGSMRLTSKGYEWFNPVRYAKKHDEGIGVPKRSFMWLSGRGMNLISKATLDWIVKK